MNKQKAIVKMNYGEALYIYYQGVIQCLICGWWHKGNTIEDAKELWQTHAIIEAHNSIDRIING